MKQLRIRIGDIFSVPLANSKMGYFQYIANDLTQLNSAVIRVFRKRYSCDEVPHVSDVAKDGVDFYAHVVLRNGVKLGYWRKAGNVSDIGKTDILFRCTSDLGMPNFRVSEKWYVWTINKPTVRIGKLDSESRKIELGVVFSPKNILHRMQTGRYEYYSD